MKLTLFFMDPRTRHLLCLPSKQFASNQPLPSVLVTWAYSIRSAITLLFSFTKCHGRTLEVFLVNNVSLLVKGIIFTPPSVFTTFSCKNNKYQSVVFIEQQENSYLCSLAFRLTEFAKFSVSAVHARAL